ncbi:Chitinase domain-containing protein 1 [Hordeum vulgare]|nr:Chitinase domain-containing protein 1 [Hordeum vulgare]
MNSISNPKPSPWGMGWRAFYLEVLGDRAKFEEMMEVCSNFMSMVYVHKEADVVVKKAAVKEFKMLIPGPMKGAISADILRWDMNHANLSDAQQRATWAKYREYIVPMMTVPWCTRRH